MNLVVYQGILYAIVASILWSFNPLIIKKYGYGISPIALNLLRIAAAFLFLLIVMIFRGLNIVLSFHGLLFIVASALIGPGTGDIAYIKCIRVLGAGRAITIGYLYIFIAQFLSALLLGETINVNLITGSVLAFLGIYFVFKEDVNREVDLGKVFIGFIPAVAWGIGSVVNKFALNYSDPLSLGFARSIILTLILLPISFNEAKSGLLVKRIVFTAIVTGGLGYGVGIPLFLEAIKIVGVTVTVLSTTLTPVLGRLLSVVFADEKINYEGLIGTLLVVSGILIGLANYL